MSLSATALSVRGVHKSYGKDSVLAGIDFELRQGEYLGLIGVNGSGKTTLIKSLLNACEISSGTIEIFGRSHQQTAARERLAFLPERFIPPYFATGQDFLKFIGTLYGHRYDSLQVSQVLMILDLSSDALSKPVRALSKGMAQKLGLAACFLSKKELFILDEPMSGLDPKARAFVKNHLVSRKSQGQTVFFSSHLLADLEALCDRLAVLHEGVLRFIGTPTELKRAFAEQDLEQAYLRCVGA